MSIGGIIEILTVPRVMREKLGDDMVDFIIELINKSNEKQKQDVPLFAEDKFGRRLSEEMAKINQRITEEISNDKQRISD